jgi:DNA-binding NtrC family response regulator
MQEALVSLQRVAPTDLTVIIHGERGTGKEWAAHLIHQLSSRASASFFAVDCGAVGDVLIERELFGYDAITWESIEIKRGAFEEASGGTLFLHDIHLVPAPILLRAARAVEYKQFRRIGGDSTHELNIRLIATSCTSAESPGGENGAIEQFGSRLTAITVNLPPLRARKSDIPLLVDRFLHELRDRYANPVKGISKEALDLCCEHSWPGNVRQLKNAMEYAALMSAGGVIQPEHLPASLHQRDVQERREPLPSGTPNKRRG